MFREIPSLEGLRKQVEQKHLSSSRGAVQFFCFLSQGPAPVRQFVRELGNSVDQPMLDDCAGAGKKKTTTHSGMQGGPGFLYQPKP